LLPLLCIDHLTMTLHLRLHTTRFDWSVDAWRVVLSAAQAATHKCNSRCADAKCTKFDLEYNCPVRCACGLEDAAPPGESGP
jgi:hypothetical protein